MSKYQLSCLDAIDYLKSLPSNSVDVCVTDPAYESLEKHRKVGTTTRLKDSNGSSSAWFPIFPNSRYDDLFLELYRVMKLNTHLYIFCDNETCDILKPIAKKYNFKYKNTIIWDKMAIGMGYSYRRSYENILFLEKGKRKLNNFSIGDVLKFKRIKNKLAYPTEKPIELIEVLIKQSSFMDEIVLDPFMGSGNIGIAAIRNQREFWGNDIEKKSYDLTDAKLKLIP